MKFLVFSDSHRDITGMVRAVEATTDAAMIVHLGDHVSDAETLSSLFPRIPLRAVSGNNDCDSFAPGEDILTFCNQRIFLCHGHRYRVKHSPDLLLQEAKRRQCSVALFGHTHEPLCSFENGIYLMNPGSIRGLNATYGILDITDNKISIQTVRG